MTTVVIEQTLSESNFRGVYLCRRSASSEQTRFVGNMLRRISLTSIPSYAIAEGDFRVTPDTYTTPDGKTTVSKLPLDVQEMFLFGFIPLASSAALESNPQPVRLTLSVTNSTAQPIMVTSRDIVSQDVRVVPVNSAQYRMPIEGRDNQGDWIVKHALRAQGQLHITATATVATARVHARWGVVDSASFFDIDSRVTDEEEQQWHDILKTRGQHFVFVISASPKLHPTAAMTEAVKLFNSGYRT